MVHAGHHEAERLYREAMKAGDWRAHNNLAVLFDDLGRDSEAEAEFVAAIRAGDDLPHRRYGLLLPRLGRDEEARTQLEEAIDSGHEYALLDLARIASNAGAVEVADSTGHTVEHKMH